MRGQQTYRWYGEHVGDYPLPAGFAIEDLGKCEHAIRIPGQDNDKIPGSIAPYEVGVVRRRDGKPGFQLMWDFYDGGKGMEVRVGKDCTRLRQAYSIAVATKFARQQGFRVFEQTQPSGGVLLRLSK